MSRDSYPFVIQDKNLFEQIERRIRAMREGTFFEVMTHDFQSAYTKIEKSIDHLFGSEISPLGYFHELHGQSVRASIHPSGSYSVIIEKGKRKTELRLVYECGKPDIFSLEDNYIDGVMKSNGTLQEVPVEPPRWVFKRI